MDKSTKHLPRESIGDSYNSVPKGHFFIFKEVFSENSGLMYGLHSRVASNQKRLMMARIWYLHSGRNYTKSPFIFKTVLAQSSLFSLWKQSTFTKPFEVKPSWHQLKYLAFMNWTTQAIIGDWNFSTNLYYVCMKRMQKYLYLNHIQIIFIE